jgi:transposase-like protein
MRYPAAEKLEIIRLVEQSHLPVRRTLAKISIPPTTFYRWYDRFVDHGPEGLEDRPSSPSRVWNRIPDAVRDQIVDLALEEPELSPRELAVRFTDREKYFVSEASVYRLLKSHDLIAGLSLLAVAGHPDFAPRPGRRTTDPVGLFDHNHIQSHVPRGKGAGEARRPAARHQNIAGHLPHQSATFGRITCSATMMR